MGNSVEDFKVGAQEGHRDRQRVVITGSARSTYFSPPEKPAPQLYAAGSSERCLDYNHGLSYDLLLRYRKDQQSLRNVDLGHPFAKESVSLSMPSVIHTEAQLTPSVRVIFDGVFAPSTDYKLAMQQVAAGRFPAIPTGLGTDRFALWGLGSTAIARSLPQVPQFSLFRFIGELRAGMPRLPGKVIAESRKVRNVGGEYLNVQFGLMPTVSDIQNLIEVLGNPALRAAVKHQLYEEHRVRKTIDKGTVSTSRPLTGAEMSSIVGAHSSGIAGTLETRKSFRIWSSCSFVYHQVEMFDQLLTDLDRKMGGVGVVPTAIDIWNLVPWSWLVDWFTNFNHVITNLSYLGRDGLRLQRGYIMGTFEDVETTTQRRTFMNVPISTTGVRTFERKYRVRASPFGFGLTWKDFDPFQLSILGALGISRLRF